MKFIGSKSVLSQGACQAEADRRNMHSRRQQKPQRMLKTPQARSEFATSSQSSPPMSISDPSLIDPPEERHLLYNMNAEVNRGTETVSAVTAVAEDGVATQAMSEEHGMESSVSVETSRPTGAWHDAEATESAAPQLPAALSATLCDDSASAATEPVDDHPDTSEAVIWAGKPADRGGDAERDASLEDRSSSSSSDLGRKGSRVASKLECGNGDAFGSAWISAPVLQNEVGSLVMPHTWRYMPPPRPPVPEVAPSSEATGKVRRLETESSACKTELESVSKRRLVAEVVDQLIARSHRVEHQLGAELRSGRALRVTLEVLQRQNVCLQMQLL